MNVGILGGTFNPPHIGHLILAQEAKEQLKLDKIFFIPANRPPHKDKDLIDCGFRLKMVQLALEGNPDFAALDIEVKRKGVSYTVDTFFELKKTYPEDSFFLMIGSDLANSFDQWREPHKIKEMADIVVVERKGMPLLNKNDFFSIKITQIDISSSMIRQRVRDYKTIKYLVPDKVEGFIKENDLYL